MKVAFTPILAPSRCIHWFQIESHDNGKDAWSKSTSNFRPLLHVYACVCQRLTCTDVVDNLRRSTFGSEEAIHGPNERLDYRSACWLRSQESEERTLQQCERSRPRSVATYGRGRRARTAASKAHRRGHSYRPYGRAA